VKQIWTERIPLNSTDVHIERHLTVAAWYDKATSTLRIDYRLFRVDTLKEYSAEEDGMYWVFLRNYPYTTKAALYRHMLALVDDYARQHMLRVDLD
jgi:hypothetical protein